MFLIEKNIPLPRKGANRTQVLYPFHKMEVGDSFFAPNAMQSKITTAYNHFRKKHAQRKFTTRQENGGTRVWRVQ